MKCIEQDCKGKMSEKGYVHVTTVGRNRVEDGSATAPTCGRCGAVAVTGAALARYEQNAAELLLTDPKAIFSGEVIKFVRKVLGLRQVDLAKRLGCRAEQISRYEATERPEAWLRMAMLGLLLETTRKATPDSVHLKRAG